MRYTMSDSLRKNFIKMILSMEEEGTFPYCPVHQIHHGTLPSAFVFLILFFVFCFIYIYILCV
jgi:hypothetical protein